MTAPNVTTQSMYGNFNYQNTQCMKEIGIFLAEYRIKEYSQFPSSIYQQTPEAELAFEEIISTAPLYAAAVQSELNANGQQNMIQDNSEHRLKI